VVENVRLQEMAAIDAATHCNPVQHTATHCNNTLQHTATTHYNTLQQHTATTHCTTPHHAATHCNTLPHTARPCNLSGPERVGAAACEAAGDGSN